MTTHILGYPRIGEKRELKFALEQYWRGEIEQSELEEVGSQLRQKSWAIQAKEQLGYVTVGDFAWYDHVLNTSLLLGHIPQRHATENVTIDTLFKIARGRSQGTCGCAASDMTKWFNTNYHYIVPEFNQADNFEVTWSQLFQEIKEAQSLGYEVKPVLLGPVSYLYLGKEIDEGFDRLTLLPKLVEAYQTIFEKLDDLGIEWVQLDEPVLTLDLDSKWQAACERVYHSRLGKTKILLTTYFDSVVDTIGYIANFEVDGLHIDISAAPEQLDSVVKVIPEHWVLSVGVVNGRNVWRTDLSHALETLSPVKQKLGERLWIASSCSLLHSPVDLEQEVQLEEVTKSWFAFAKQKVSELGLLKRALADEELALEQCEAYSQPIKARLTSEQVNKPKVQERLSKISTSLADRSVPYASRAKSQAEKLQLPLLPTTTIGSFPQTAEIRHDRSAFKRGAISQDSYNNALKGHIADAVSRQEALGLDVLVHGEAERNDMVEYFAEHLAGFQTTQFGWVQSYGSRCVKPAVVVTDIERPTPITVDWTQYAQSLTTKHMKGMLTGPVTIMCWTFPREDISKQEITNQIALALRDEVSDLQNAGINIIQIDEPAIREGLPLKKAQHQTYLDWAVRAFKISAGSAKPETQIHTHMCYSEFNEIIDSVAALDADVITIETSRSNMELLKAFEEFNYPNEIGPGVYDIHSPNIPSEEWVKTLLKKAATKIPVERLWVNPDCGLKTRTWEETEAALEKLVTAAKDLRVEFA